MLSRAADDNNGPKNDAGTFGAPADPGSAGRATGALSRRVDGRQSAPVPAEEAERFSAQRPERPLDVARPALLRPERREVPEDLLLPAGSEPLPPGPDGR